MQAISSISFGQKGEVSGKRATRTKAKERNGKCLTAKHANNLFDFIVSLVYCQLATILPAKLIGAGFIYKLSCLLANRARATHLQTFNLEMENFELL